MASTRFDPNFSMSRRRRWTTIALCLCLWALSTLAALAQPAPPTKNETRVYALSHLGANTVRSRLTVALGDAAKATQILADQAGNRLIVAAPPQVHNQISALVAQIDIAPPKPAAAEVVLQLQTLTGTTLHQRLELILGEKLPTKLDPTGQWLGFNVGLEKEESVYLWANKSTGEVHIHGTDQRVASWKRVLSVLDQPTPAGTKTELKATNQDASPKAKQAIGMLVKQQIAARPAQVATEGDTEEPDSLTGPVQVETVDGTDILVIRGNPEDVERVLRIIEEIERISEISEPKIQVVELQHVESEALAALLQQVFNETLTPRYGYGSIVVVPLVKPNAVLFVGSPTTVEKAIEIQQKLDQPGKELTQYKLFRLQFAQAGDTQQVLENLFDTETDEDSATLRPKALVIADNRTNSLIVRASPRDMGEITQLIRDLDKEGSDTVNELRVFKLKNVLAEELEQVLEDAFEPDTETDGANLSQLLRFTTIDAEGREQLESGVLAGARVTANRAANALVISAPPKTIDLLEALITQLDQVPDVGIELRVFTIVNGDATALSEMLLGLFGTGDQSGGGGGGRNNNDEQELTALRVEVDERTNSIIAAGSNDDLVTVEAILRTLDSADTRQRQNKVYRLKNKYAEDVSTALNEWLRAEAQVQGTAPGLTSPFQQIEREVVIVPEISSNSLIVSATPRYYDEIARLVEEIDKQDPMVMIQVLIAEIALGDLDEFGVELGLQDSVLFDRSLLGDLLTTTTTVIEQVGGNNVQVQQDVIQAATLTPGFNFGDPGTGLGNSGSTSSVATAGNVASQALSSFGVGRVSTEGGFGGLVLSASSDSISALLRALQESTRTEVLSRPQIMTLDNQTGYAFVGQQVPFITEAAISSAGTPLNTVERVNVGLSLQVTPRISPDNLVVMNVTATNDRLGPLNEGVPIGVAANGDPILQPIVDSIEATTTVSAVSGQTVVLSGLIQKRDTALHRRVPILADVPLLGDLFRFDSMSTQRSELLIVLTPHVIRSRVESDMLKQVESARMSWCLSDVVDLHGPAGLRSRSDPAGAAEAETIYPDSIPTEEMMPRLSPIPETQGQGPTYEQ